MKLKYNGNAIRELKKRIGLDYSSSTENNSRIGLGLPSTSSSAKTGAGFTLVELLIVIAVIGVLAAGLLVLVNPVEQMKRARDSKVKSNVAQIQTALELFRADCGRYPASLPTSGSLTSDTCPGGYSGPRVTYIQTMPSFPAGPASVYSPGSGNGSYIITACLENRNEALGNGVINSGSCTSARAFQALSP